MLSQVRFKHTKNARNGHSKYVRCNIEDMSGSIECVMWPDDLARHKEEPANEQVCFVRGSLDPRSQNGKPLLLLTRFLSVEQAQRELTQVIVISLNAAAHDPSVIDWLARTLPRGRGTCPVYLDFRDGAGRRARVRLPEEFLASPLSFPKAELEAVLGSGAVRFAVPGNGNGRNGK